MRSVLLSVLGALSVAAAHAGTPDGLYVSGAAGINVPLAEQSSGGTTRLDTSTGSIALAALGWGFGNGLRLEVEGDDRWNSIHGIGTLRSNGSLVDLSNSSGHLGSYAAMTNLVYDLDLPELPITPYFGGGVGYAWQRDDASGDGLGIFRVPVGNRVLEPDHVNLNGTKGAFAYQAIGGASLPLPFVSGLDAMLEYRYFATESATFPITRIGTSTNIVNGIRPSSHGTESFASHDHAIVIGLRYAFGGI